MITYAYSHASCNTGEKVVTSVHNIHGLDIQLGAIFQSLRKQKKKRIEFLYITNEKQVLLDDLVYILLAIVH